MNRAAPTLGILGGMGPLASAAFVQTIYEYNQTPTEQEAPQVVLFSMPAAPDRCQSIHGGSEQPFIDFVHAQLRRLAPLCDRMLIGCCTAHYALPSIPVELRQQVISLLDVTDDALTSVDEPALLLASSGTYQKRLFQDSCRHRDRIISLSTDDQQVVMGLIFDVLKKVGDPLRALPEVERLLAKYGTRTFIVGCTEFHLLARALVARGDSSIRFVDALSIVARDYFQLLGR
jgi:aspartate racemase